MSLVLAVWIGYWWACPLPEQEQQARYVRVKTLLADQDYEAVKLACNEWIKREPKNDVAYLYRANANLMLNQNAAATVDANAALSLVPNSEGGLLFRAWSRLHSATNEAIRDLNKILSKEPEHANALAARSWAHYLLGKQDEAWSDSEKSLRLDPKQVYAHATQSYVYLDRGRWQESIVAADNALKLQADFVVASLSRAKALALLGNKSESTRMSQKANSFDAQIASAFAAQLAGEQDSKPACRKKEVESIK